MSDITLILESIGNGGKHKPEELLPLLYEELRTLASMRMSQEAAGHTLQPTALVHEAWLRLVGNTEQSWQNRAHFFGAASEAMRRILIERARRKASVKHGGNLNRMNIEGMEIAEETPEENLLMINAALHKMETENPERARIVVLKFFGGLSNREVADLLNIGERTVNRHWLCAKTWLFRTLKSEFQP